MTIRGVLFDFSGTLFRFDVAQAIRSVDPTADVDARDGLPGHIRLLRSFTLPVGQPPGLTPELQPAWDRRDLDPDGHRHVHHALLQANGVSDADARRVYELLPAVESWSPYPDTSAALRRLAGRGTPVGVLSNIAWDIRPAFARYGLEELVSAFLLSFEAGRVKPDPELFRTACAAIGTDPAETLMIGDSAGPDGAAAAIGCSVVIVEPLPIAERPRALLDALDAHGLHAA